MGQKDRDTWLLLSSCLTCFLSPDLSADQGHLPLLLTVILLVPNPSWCYGACYQQEAASQVHTQASSQERFPKLLYPRLTAHPVFSTPPPWDPAPNHQLCTKQ